MKFCVLPALTVLLLQPTCNAAAAEPAIGTLIAGGEEVMFINGARLRCESACRVLVLPEGAMRISFEPAARSRVLSLEALIGPLRVTLMSAEHGLTYELGDGRSARFDNGVTGDGSQAVLLETRSLAQIDDEPLSRKSPDVSRIVSRHPGRTLRGLRELEVGAR